MQFDEFYETVGSFGRYQKIKYLLICFTNMLPPVMVYVWTFIAATPSFHCQTPLDDLSALNLPDRLSNRYIPTVEQCLQYQKGVSLKECQRCFQVVQNTTSYDMIPCRKFVFDRTYYQSTLVEDVNDSLNEFDLCVYPSISVVNGV